MSIQKTIELFSFNELTKEVKQSLIEKHQVDDWWDQWVIRDIEYAAKEMGIEDFDLQYTGFWSQGDGLSFTGTLSKSLVEKIYKEKVNRDGFDKDSKPFSVRFERFMHSYVHEKTVSAIIADIDDDSADYVDIFKEVFNDWKDNLCREWYEILKNHYDHLTEEETIASEYDSWGTVFTKCGKTI